MAKRAIGITVLAAIVAVLWLFSPGAAAAAPQSDSSDRILVDGSKTPELIPDSRAYSMLFRLIARASRTEDQQGVIRSYIAGIGMTGKRCAECDVVPGQKDAQVDVLISIAQEFETKFLDLLADEPSSVAGAKENLYGEFLTNVEIRLGPVDGQKLRDHVVKMKSKMKIIKE